MSRVYRAKGGKARSEEARASEGNLTLQALPGVILQTIGTRCKEKQDKRKREKKTILVGRHGGEREERPTAAWKSRFVQGLRRKKKARRPRGSEKKSLATGKQKRKERQPKERHREKKDNTCGRARARGESG